MHYLYPIILTHFALFFNYPEATLCDTIFSMKMKNNFNGG